MGTVGGASLEHSYPSNSWNLAPDKPTSSISPSSAMPYGGYCGLMPKPHSDWTSLQQSFKQEPMQKSSATHQFADVYGNSPTLPYFGQVHDWSKAGSNPFVFGSSAVNKGTGKHDLLSYASTRSLPVLCFDGGESMSLFKMSPQEIMDAKALAASKSHSEAERRRRQRINSHMATLRTLLPSTTKTDKASLLAEVVHHVRELKRQAAEIARIRPVPTDVDELHVDIDSSGDENRVVIKASFSCNDRPGLLPDLSKALKDLNLKMVKAEIATLGGRVKNVMLMTRVDNVSCKQEGPSLTSVQEALKAVMEKSASNELPSSNYFSYKRQRSYFYS